MESNFAHTGLSRDALNEMELPGEAKNSQPALGQRLLVFQQRGSAEKKIKGIRDYGEGRFQIEVISIDRMLPTIIDDAQEYLELEPLRADLVLDFLRHPDLSQDVALHFSKKGIPVVASGKKWHVKNVFTPPT